MIGTSAFRGPQTPNRASLKDGEVALVLVEGAEDEVGRPEGDDVLCLCSPDCE